MRETFTSGSVGRAPGNRCLYPEWPWSPMPKRSRANHLLQHKPCIALGRHLRPLGPHDGGTVWTGEQEPGFPGNVRSHEPRVGLGPENLRARLRDMLGPCRFRLGRGRNPRTLMIAHIGDAVAYPVHERLSGSDEVTDRRGI